MSDAIAVGIAENEKEENVARPEPGKDDSMDNESEPKAPTGKESIPSIPPIIRKPVEPDFVLMTDFDDQPRQWVIQCKHQIADFKRFDDFRIQFGDLLVRLVQTYSHIAKAPEPAKELWLGRNVITEAVGFDIHNFIDNKVSADHRAQILEHFHPTPYRYMFDHQIVEHDVYMTEPLRVFVNYMTQEHMQSMLMGAREAAALATLMDTSLAVVPPLNYTDTAKFHQPRLAMPLPIGSAIVALNPRLGAKFADMSSGILRRFLSFTNFDTRDSVNRLMAKVRSQAFTSKLTNDIPREVISSDGSQVIFDIYRLALYPTVYRLEYSISYDAYHSINPLHAVAISVLKCFVKHHSMDRAQSLKMSNYLMHFILVSMGTSNFEYPPDWRMRVEGDSGYTGFDLTAHVYNALDFEHKPASDWADDTLDLRSVRSSKQGAATLKQMRPFLYALPREDLLNNDYRPPVGASAAELARARARLISDIKKRIAEPSIPELERARFMILLERIRNADRLPVIRLYEGGHEQFDPLAFFEDNPESELNYGWASSNDPPTSGQKRHLTDDYSRFAAPMNFHETREREKYYEPVVSENRVSAFKAFVAAAVNMPSRNFSEFARAFAGILDIVSGFLMVPDHFVDNINAPAQWLFRSGFTSMVPSTSARNGASDRGIQEDMEQTFMNLPDGSLGDGMAIANYLNTKVMARDSYLSARRIPIRFEAARVVSMATSIRVDTVRMTDLSYLDAAPMRNLMYYINMYAEAYLWAKRLYPRKYGFSKSDVMAFTFKVAPAIRSIIEECVDYNVAEKVQNDENEDVKSPTDPHRMVASLFIGGEGGGGNQQSMLLGPLNAAAKMVYEQPQWFGIGSHILYNPQLLRPTDAALLFQFPSTLSKFYGTSRGFGQENEDPDAESIFVDKLRVEMQQANLSAEEILDRLQNTDAGSLIHPIKIKVKFTQGSEAEGQTLSFQQRPLANSFNLDSKMVETNPFEHYIRWKPVNRTVRVSPEIPLIYPTFTVLEAPFVYFNDPVVLLGDLGYSQTSPTEKVQILEKLEVVVAQVPYPVV
jgi:hypothetical protein